MKVAIIIVHFGEIINTLDCIRSIKNIRSKIKFKTFIIDNQINSIKDKDIKKILPHFILIKNKKIAGFSEGANIAIKKAMKENFDYYLVLSNDLILDEKILEELIKHFGDPKIGITGSVILNSNSKNKIWYAGGHLNNFFSFTTHPKMGDTYNSKNINSNFTDYISGGFMIKKDIFKKVGFFDEEYYLYWEDVDFCTRALKKGFKSFLVNKPLIKHKVSSSTGKEGTKKLTPLMAYYFGKNGFVFISKNKFNKIGGIMGQFFIRFPYYLFFLENLESFKEYLRGTKDGLFYLLRN